MTSIQNNYHSDTWTRASSNSHRSHSKRAGNTMSNAFHEHFASRRRGNHGGNRRQYVRQQMSRMVNQQSQSLQAERQGQEHRHACPGFGTVNGNNSVDQQINSLLEQMGILNQGEPGNLPGATDPLNFQNDISGFDLNELLQSLGLNSPSSSDLNGLTGLEDMLNQLLQQLSSGNRDNAPMMPPVTMMEDRIEITLDTKPISGDTTDSDTIPSLLDDFDHNQLNDLLQAFSLDELAQMLSDEGTTVSADELMQLLAQLGLTTDTDNTTETGMDSDRDMPINDTPIPVEPNNGIGDGANPITTDDNGTVQAQAILDSLDSGQLANLLQMFSLDDLAQMLSDEGTQVSSGELMQLLTQLGLATDSSSMDSAMPADGSPATTNIPSADMMTTSTDTGTDTDTIDATAANIQTLLDGFDTSQLNDLLQIFSLDELAQMLSSEGTQVSASELSLLLTQLGLISSGTEAETNAADTSSTAAETSSDTPSVNTATGSNSTDETQTSSTNADNPTDNTSNADIQSLLNGLDAGQLNDLLQVFSLDELAQMLSSEGTQVSADEISLLLEQLGLLGPDSGITDAASNTSTAGTIPPEIPSSTNTPAAENSSPSANTPTTTGSNADTELQTLLAENSGLLANVFDLFSPQELSDALAQEGTDISAGDLTALLGQLGIKA